MAEGLSEHLGGPTVLIKRDDLTGMAAGGNKLRKLEILLADALAAGCTHVITCGAAQSNHACQTAVAAATLGLGCVLVLWAPRSPHSGHGYGNVLLDDLAGARVVFLDPEGDVSREEGMKREAEAIRAQGGKPYVIPVGGSTGLGSVGYALALEEAAAQCDTWDRLPTRIVVACGSGGTAAGLMVGARALDLSAEVLAVDVDGEDTLRGDTLRCARRAARLLGLDPSPWQEDAGVSLVGGYVGPGYGIPSAECLSAIRLVARTEGVFLDPVYSAKAMAGLIGMVEEGRIGASDTVLFFHTGGLPGLFALGPEIIVETD
jgi:D-cysteine desulfhydrase family pyridoxal phosphate-dependent enzyme